MLEREMNVRMRDLVQEQRLAADIDERFLAKDRLGHAREGGEFVDHPPQIADLADNRLGQALEGAVARLALLAVRSAEHTSELQSLMRISYAVFCLTKKNTHN